MANPTLTRRTFMLGASAAGATALAADAAPTDAQQTLPALRHSVTDMDSHSLDA